MQEVAQAASTIEVINQFNDAFKQRQLLAGCCPVPVAKGKDKAGGSK